MESVRALIPQFVMMETRSQEMDAALPVWSSLDTLDQQARFHLLTLALSYVGMVEE
jgi:hypothetical protein